MTQYIDIYALAPPEPTQSEADIVRILHEALKTQTDPTAVSAKLVRTLREHGARCESPEIVEDFLWDLFTTLMDLVRVTPRDHPWHEILIVAVDDLRREGGVVAESDPSSLWEDLPLLSMYIYDKWADPTDFPDLTLRDIETWKRWNSFISGLTARGCEWWIVLGDYGLYDGLETVSQVEWTSFDATTVFESKLWAATEWLIRAGGILFADLTSNKEHIPEEDRAIRLGPLCGDIIPCSVQRWDFWLRRLKELTEKKSTTVTRDGTSHDVVLSEDSLSRVEQAIAAMHRWRSRAEAEGQSMEKEPTGRR